MIKLTACVYRPWIREPRIIPAGDAITTSTGYSFPSGHTAMAVPIYGGIALTANKKRKAISAICIILALLTMFSRNYLGVHTPQDVIVGCLIGCLTLAAGQKIFAYIQKHPEKEDPILAAGFAAGWLALIYISVKSYPMDYVNGVLLVDPQKMMRDGYGDLGLFIGFCLSRFIERKYIGFKPCGTNSKGIAIGIAGIIAIQLFRLLLRTPLSNALGIHWGHFVYNFFIAFYVTALYPAVIKYVFSAQKGLSH